MFLSNGSPFVAPESAMLANGAVLVGIRPPLDASCTYGPVPSKFFTGVGVTVTIRVAVAEGVNIVVAVWVSDGVPVGVAVIVGVLVGSAVDVGSAVAVGNGVAVGAGAQAESTMKVGKTTSRMFLMYLTGRNSLRYSLASPLYHNRAPQEKHEGLCTPRVLSLEDSVKRHPT